MPKPASSSPRAIAALISVVAGARLSQRADWTMAVRARRRHRKRHEPKLWWRHPCNPLSGRLLILFVESVTSGADGADNVDRAVYVDRLAQPTDMDVDGPELDVAVAAPDAVEQTLA